MSAHFRFILSVLAGSGLLAGCDSLRARPTPHDRLHFPTGIAVDAPYGTDAGPAHFLYVAGFTNFDLAKDDALFYALELDAMNPNGHGLLPTALALDAGWDGTPLQIPDLDGGNYSDPQHGVVVTDSMAGEVRLVRTSAGTSRLFLATRYQNVVTAIDVQGGSLTCYGGGSNCNNPVAAPPLVIEQSQGANQLLDVFGLSNEVVTAGGERDIFITHLRNQGYGSGGIYNTGLYTNNTSQTGAAYLIRQNVDNPACRLAEPVGIVGSSSAVAITQGDLIYTLFTGRYGGLSNAVRELILPVSGCQVPTPGSPTQTPVDPLAPTQFTVDLAQITKGNDGRGIVVSTNGDRVFALTRNPDAIVVLRTSGFTPGGLLIHPSSVAPLPPGPVQLLAIPRHSPTGQHIGDLVAVACTDAREVAFYDDELGTKTFALGGVGDEPFGLAAAERSEPLPGGETLVLPGVRLFATAFGSGQIAVIDIPDLLDATSARVVAFIGTYEDTTITPISPNSNILNTSVGGGPTGIP